MGFTKRDVVSLLGLCAAVALTPLVILTTMKYSDEAGRWVNKDISAPQSKLSKVGSLWSTYSNLLLNQQGYGESMFTNIACDWGQYVGLDIPVNESPDVPLYYIPGAFLPAFGYAAEYAALSAAGIGAKMLCIPQANNTALCDCDLDISHPENHRWLRPDILLGNVFKWNSGSKFASVWIDDKGYVRDSDGNFKEPNCYTNSKKHALSLTHIFTVWLANHYIEIHICIENDVKFPYRYMYWMSVNFATTILLGLVAIVFAVLFQHKLGVRVIPTDVSANTPSYEEVATASPRPPQKP